MLVAVVSDTHGNRAGLRSLAARLKELKVARVLHLGDDYQDLRDLAAAGFEVLGVPGVFCPEYSDPGVENRPVVELAGVKMLLSHTPQRHRHDRPRDPDPEAPPAGVKLVLYGHTHVPALEERDGVWRLNPGHLRPHADKGHPPSFALLDISPGKVRVSIRRLEDGEIFLERKISV